HVALRCLPTRRSSDLIFCGADFHFDLVRPGASLYGINPTPQAPSPVLPVVNLRLPILQARELTESAAVGYGATVNVTPSTRLLRSEEQTSELQSRANL